MFDDIGFGELLVIVTVALVVFGPGRLPELGRAAGRALREFRHAIRDVQEQVVDAAHDRRSTGTRKAEPLAEPKQPQP